MATEGQAAVAPASAAQAPAAADPVSRIQAMLTAETAPPPKAEEQPNDAPPPESEEEVPAGPNKGKEGDEAPPEEQQQEEETGAVAEIPMDQLEAIELEVTVKGDDGKDVVEKPTIKELRQGYMRQKDYQRKTAEVARQREEVGEKVRQGIESERTQYVQNLQVLEAALIETAAPELQNVDWNSLAQNDAFEYVRLQNRAQQITSAVNSVRAKIKEVSDKQAAEQQIATKQRAAKAVERLEQNIPGWNDTLYQTLIKSGETYGFAPQEVSTWLDPRSIEVLHDAYQYRQMKAAPTTKKVVAAPKVVRPGNANGEAQSQQRRADAFNKLQKSGGLQDAAAVIAGRINRR